MTDISSLLRDDEIFIELGGEINKGDVQGIKRRIDIELELYRNKDKLVLDMEGVTYANHKFADLVLDYEKQLRMEGRSVRIRNPNPGMYAVLATYYEGLKERGAIRKAPKIEINPNYRLTG